MTRSACPPLSPSQHEPHHAARSLSLPFLRRISFSRPILAPPSLTWLFHAALFTTGQSSFFTNEAKLQALQPPFSTTNNFGKRLLIKRIFLIFTVAFLPRRRSFSTNVSDVYKKNVPCSLSLEFHYPLISYGEFFTSIFLSFPL